MENRVRYSGIDVCKFIMALLVVWAHTSPLYGINNTLNFLTCNVICRITVPFFFAATGFLLERQILYRKCENPVKPKAGPLQVISKYLRKVLELYLLWSLIYLPVIIWDKFIDSEDTLLRCIFMEVRDFVFVGSYSHLWYLLAVAVGVILVYVLRKYLGESMTAGILLILFCMGLLTQSYFGLFEKAVSADGIVWQVMTVVKKVMVTCRNGVFFGGIFIYMGTWMARHNRKVSAWKAGVGLGISILLFAIEAGYLFQNGYVREQDMFLMQLPCAFFLMLVAIWLPVKADTFFLRKMSMNIYYVHLYFKFIYRKLLQDDSGSNVGLFWFVLAGALLTSYIIYRVDGSRKVGKVKK